LEDLAGKAIAAPRVGADRVRPFPRTQRRAREADCALERTLRDDRTRPDAIEQFVFRDDAFAMADQVQQQIEYERFDDNLTSAQSQFAPFLVQLEGIETESHPGSSRW